MNNNNRVAIFQAEWPLQIHTLNAAIMLAREGVNVDIFLYKVALISEIDIIKKFKNIKVYSFEEPKVHTNNDINHIFLWKNIQKIRDFLEIKTRLKNIFDIFELFLFAIGNHDFFIPQNITNDVLKAIKDKQFKVFIGVEKLGLIWATQISKIVKTSVIYYSLELYDMDQFSTWRLRRIKKAEEAAHKGTLSTIIQDSRRGKVLFKYNSVIPKNVFYVPVSVIQDDAVEVTSNDLFFNIIKKLKLRKNQVLILQFGKLERFGLDLAKIAQGFPENWTLVLHDGLAENFWNKSSLIRKIKEVNVNNKVILSTEKLTSIQIQDLIRSSNIGLVFYPQIDLNNYLTAFASEKLALYLSQKIPIISFNYEGYEHIEECKCGVIIPSLNEITPAINLILQEYKTYQENTSVVFQEYYNFEAKFMSVIDFIKEIK